MNNNEVLIDLGRWLGSIPEIVRMIAEEPLFLYAGGALMFGFAWLLVYKLTSWGGSD